MNFKFDHIDYYEKDGDLWVCLCAGHNQAVKDFIDKFKDGKAYNCELKQHRAKRSNDANAYCWVIMDKIAALLNTTKEDVYCKAIKDVGVFTDTPIREDAVTQWIDNWESGGIGRVCELLGDSKLDGYVKIRNYFGSSVYNTKEMSRLIDWVVEEAKGLNIETLTPRELEELKQNWRNQNG